MFQAKTQLQSVREKQVRNGQLLDMIFINENILCNIIIQPEQTVDTSLSHSMFRLIEHIE